MESLFNESWFSFGYLKTEETAKIEAISLGRQIRIEIGLYSNYMPNIPSVIFEFGLQYRIARRFPSYADPICTKMIK
jgi:hypothetical protein